MTSSTERATIKTKDDKRLARGRRWFEYHCYEGEDSSDAELWHHTHQQVIVLKKISEPNSADEHETGRMYCVRFADGFEYDIFDDELVKNPKDFYRPDYQSERSNNAHQNPDRQESIRPLGCP